MKHLSLAFTAIAALALYSAPAFAQEKAAAPKPITQEQKAAGMKDAPAAITAAGLTCDLTDAAYLGDTGKSKVYEVACKNALGYIIVAGHPAPAGAAPAEGTGTKTYDCLTTLGNANLACRLPENADPKQGLAPLVAAGGVSGCTLKDARAIGGDKKGDIYFEAACADGSGYIVEKMAAGSTPPVTLTPCIQTLDSANIACKLTSRADTVAYVAKMAAPAGRTCAASGARYVGSSASTGETYYELACGASPGFIFRTDKTGVFQIAVDCGKATNIAGGCKMTDTTKAATEENNNYTLLSKAAGFNCDVKAYRFIGMVSNPTKGEVVELACSNRPDGRVAVFPVDAKVKPTFIDCVRSGQYGDAGICQLTPLTPIYARFSAALAAKGRKSCTVSGARYLGHSPQNTDYIETACADGGPGWVIEFTADDGVKELLSCGQAKASGLECKLPTNLGK
jgi:hypothetical protein